MYCPKCEKIIKRERLEELERELMERFDNRSISLGLCPVCGTPLIELQKEGD